MSAPIENIDYAHTSNVARMHAAAARESGDPTANATPISLGVVAGLIGIAMLAGSYFGGNKGKDLSAANIKGYDYPREYDGVAGAGGGELDPLQLHQPENWIAAGKALFSTNCQSCHQASGAGVPGTYPPLAGSEFVINGEKRPISILIHGLNGSVIVNGKAYNGQMPPQGAKPNTEIAQLLSYIRSEWGNKASIIYEDQVAAVRKEIGTRSGYTGDEIRALPADASAPPSVWPDKLKAAAGPPAAGAAPAAKPAAAPAAK